MFASAMVILADGGHTKHFWTSWTRPSGQPSRHGGGHAFAVSANAVSQAWPDCPYHLLKKGNSSSHEAAQAGVTAALASWIGRPTVAAMASTKPLPDGACSAVAAGSMSILCENNSAATHPKDHMSNYAQKNWFPKVTSGGL